MENKIRASIWPSPFKNLNDFLYELSSRFREWSASLESQTIFFENVIQNHINGEDSLEMRSKSNPKPLFQKNKSKENQIDNLSKMKKEFNELKKTKSRAVENQKKYMKCCEKEIQFIYGAERFSNFIFKSKKKEVTNKFIGWSIIEGLNMSNREIR